MAMYAIHCPPLGGDNEAAAEAMRARRMGFSYFGFVFGPFWLAAQRLWLPLIVYFAVAALLSFLFAAGVFAAPAALALDLLAGIFIGLEGRNWVGIKLARRGLPLVDIIEARNADEAARVYFTRALANPTPPPTAPVARSIQPPAGEIIGLFPEARR
jgi:hypothetical protein